MKKILCILLSLLLVLLNGCSSDTGNIRFGAAGVGGMYYTFANSFTGILSKENENYSSVSYTHLTLPTILLV